MANFLEVIDGKPFEDLRAQVEGQQQADESDQLIVPYDDGKRFLQAGVRACRASVDFSLTVHTVMPMQTMNSTTMATAK